jgi:hypothetical protein
MNKNLLELADKAGLELTRPSDVEKFAKLIIDQCCKMINTHVQHNNPYDCIPVLNIKEYFDIEPNLDDLI